MLFFILIIILVMILSNHHIEAFTGIPFRSPFSHSFFEYHRKQETIGVTNKKWIKYFEGSDNIVELLSNQIDILDRLSDGSLDAGILSSSISEINTNATATATRMLEVDELYSVVIVPNWEIPPLLDVRDIHNSHSIGMLKEGGDTFDQAQRVFGFLGKKPRFVLAKDRDELVRLYKNKHIDGVYLMMEPTGNNLFKRLTKAQPSHLIGFSQLNNGHLFNRMPSHEHRFYKQNPGLNKKLLDIINLVDRYPHLKINKGGRSKIYLPSISTKYYLVGPKLSSLRQFE